MTTTMFNPAERAAWEVAVQRGLPITAADLRALITAATRPGDWPHAAQAQGRRAGRPTAVSDDMLTYARARRAHGEPVTSIARHLRVGRSTLYRALGPGARSHPAGVRTGDQARPTAGRPG